MTKKNLIPWILTIFSNTTLKHDCFLPLQILSLMTFKTDRVTWNETLKRAIHAYKIASRKKQNFCCIVFKITGKTEQGAASSAVQALPSCRQAGEATFNSLNSGKEKDSVTPGCPLMVTSNKIIIKKYSTNKSPNKGSGKKLHKTSKQELLEHPDLSRALPPPGPPQETTSRPPRGKGGGTYRLRHTWRLPEPGVIPPPRAGAAPRRRLPAGLRWSPAGLRWSPAGGGPSARRDRGAASGQPPRLISQHEKGAPTSWSTFSPLCL